MSNIDKYILFFLGHPQSGWINIGTKDLNRAEFLHKLTIAKAALQTITLIPGETSVIFLEQAAKQLGLDKDILLKEFQAQAPYDEGFFYQKLIKSRKALQKIYSFKCF